MKLSDLKQYFFNQLVNFSKSEKKIFFNMLCEHFLKILPHQVSLNYEIEVSNSNFKFFKRSIKRLKSNEPIQYVLGYTHFFGHKFKVSSSVLIPRPETEELISWIFECYNKNDSIKILDLGTGSGCIAITLAKYFSNSKVFALDISSDALKIARTNAKKHDVEISFNKADILNLKIVNENYDLIVSNPPYVCKNEISKMAPNVLEHEPHLALFVEDSTPLIFYEAIKQITLSNLSSKGFCFLEINESFGNELKNLFEDINFKNVVLKKDTFNRNRMIMLQKY